MDPREAIDAWFEFAKHEGHSLVPFQRRFDFDIDLINAMDQEAESLFRFCRYRGLDQTRELAELPRLSPTKQGHEHKVFLPREGGPSRVTKVTFPDKYGRHEHTPFLYLERLALCNYLFPELDIRFADFIKSNDGRYSFITTMQAFVGPHPDLDEIDDFLYARGFEKLQAPLTIDYTNRSVGIHLRDCHSRNWIKRGRGILIPIDVTPERIVQPMR